MNIIQIVSDILAQTVEIHGLPESRLVAYSPGWGTVVVPKFDVLAEDLLKIVRLQTLLKIVESNTGLQSQESVLEDIGNGVHDDNPSFNNFLRNDGAIRRSVYVQVITLERLIVELIQSFIPAESDRFDVAYRISTEKQIMFHEVCFFGGSSD